MYVYIVSVCVCVCVCARAHARVFMCETERGQVSSSQNLQVFFFIQIYRNGDDIPVTFTTFVVFSQKFDFFFMPCKLVHWLSRGDKLSACKCSLEPVFNYFVVFVFGYTDNVCVETTYGVDTVKLGHSARFWPKESNECERHCLLAG